MKAASLALFFIYGTTIFPGPSDISNIKANILHMCRRSKAKEANRGSGLRSLTKSNKKLIGLTSNFIVGNLLYLNKNTS